MTVKDLIRHLLELPHDSEVLLADTYYVGGGDEPEDLDEPLIHSGNNLVVLCNERTRYIGERATRNLSR